MQESGKVRMAPVVSGEYVRKLRISLGLTQIQFAKIMEVGNITVANWEKNGIDGTRSSSFPNFKYLTTMLRQSMNHPGLVEPSRFVRYLRMAADHELMACYIPFIGELETDYLNVINSGSLTGVLFALLFDKDLQRRGIQEPSGKLPGEDPLAGLTFNEDHNLLEGLEKVKKKSAPEGSGGRPKKPEKH
jgi:transcriptional regulator with XRE-family HTH domain